MKKLPSRKQTSTQNSEIKLFNKIYHHKFCNDIVTDLAERRRIVASQLRPQKKNIDQQQNTQTSFNPMRYKSKSVGSLLPRIQQIEVIAKSQSSNKKKSRSSSSLSQLQIYLTKKNLKKQQYNTLFLTQSNHVISDQEINQKFDKLISISSAQKPKNLRALLTMSKGIQISPEMRLKKINNQKEELTNIMRDMISEHRTQKVVNQPQNNQIESDQDSFQQEQVENPQKSIKWVLKECDKYEKHLKGNRKNKKKKVKLTIPNYPSNLNSQTNTNNNETNNI